MSLKADLRQFIKAKGSVSKMEIEEFGKGLGYLGETTDRRAREIANEKGFTSYTALSKQGKSYQVYKYIGLAGNSHPATGEKKDYSATCQPISYDGKQGVMF